MDHFKEVSGEFASETLNATKSQLIGEKKSYPASPEGNEVNKTWKIFLDQITPRSEKELQKIQQEEASRKTVGIKQIQSGLAVFSHSSPREKGSGPPSSSLNKPQSRSENSNLTPSFQTSNIRSGSETLRRRE